MSNPASGPKPSGASSRPAKKGLYILPSMFTAANIAAGYYAISQAIQGTAGDPWHFDQAAKAIGFAILFDGLDGRIARLTNTASAFGREFDSLADVIAFGIAPAILAWLWGFRALPAMDDFELRNKVVQLGAIATFIFLMAGAARLARFNIQANPQPSNPGRPGRKYFVGMPIPAGAGVVAAVVHFVSGNPLQMWWLSIGWGVFVFVLSFLMVSTWRFYSFKELNLRRPLNFRWIIVFGGIIGLGWFFSRYVLFLLALGLHSRGGSGSALLCFPAAHAAAASTSGRGLARLMKNDPKTTSPVHPEAGSWGGLFRVAIVGAATLKGRELKDVLSERNFPTHDVRLLDDDESLGQLEAVGDEPTFIQSVLPEHMEDIDFTFFASDDPFTRNTWEYREEGGQRHYRFVERAGRCGGRCFARPVGGTGNRQGSAR